MFLSSSLCDIIFNLLFYLAHSHSFFFVFFFFKQKTAYEMRISDWSSDVCSSDLSWWPALCPHVHRQRCGKRNGHGDSIHLPAAAHLAFRQGRGRDRRAEDRRPCAAG